LGHTSTAGLRQGFGGAAFANPALNELWSMPPDGGEERKLFDRMGPYRAIDVTFDVSPNGEIVWSEYIEGRYELWQAILRP
jgi:hypothetical protein